MDSNSFTIVDIDKGNCHIIFMLCLLFKTLFKRETAITD